MIHPRITFVTASYIAAVTGQSVETVHDVVDAPAGTPEGRRAPVPRLPGGRPFTWVFDVALGARRRELRFWSREVEHPAATARLRLEDVIAQIVPRREQVPGQFGGLRNWEVAELLGLSRRTLIELRDEFQAVNHEGSIWVPRAALADFLRRRWLFARTLATAGER